MVANLIRLEIIEQPVFKAFVEVLDETRGDFLRKLSDQVFELVKRCIIEKDHRAGSGLEKVDKERIRELEYDSHSLIESLQM